MKKPLSLATMLSIVLLAGCSEIRTPTNPTSAIKETNSSISAVPPVVVTPIPEPILATPIVPSPIVLTPPVVEYRPFGRNDCDYSNPGSVRCYNPSDTIITLTAAMNSVSCDQTFGKMTTTIPPGQNGYFTLPRPSCDKTGQIDMYFGSTEGNCRNPDFSSQRTYFGGSCPTIPVCLSNWNNPDWIEILSPQSFAIVCKKYYRILSDGCGLIRREEKEVCPVPEG